MTTTILYKRWSKRPVREIRLAIDDLKPCPFCGYEEIYAGVESSMSYHCSCVRCGARTKPVWLPDTWDLRKGIVEEWCIKQAVKLWNHRPTDVPVGVGKAAAHSRRRK